MAKILIFTISYISAIKKFTMKKYLSNIWRSHIKINLIIKLIIFLKNIIGKCDSYSRGLEKEFFDPILFENAFFSRLYQIRGDPSTWYFKFPRGRMPRRRRGCTLPGKSLSTPLYRPSSRSSPTSVITETDVARTRTNILLRLP